MRYIYKPCPKCRGYNLESQWCNHCNKTGYIKILKFIHSVNEGWDF